MSNAHKPDEKVVAVTGATGLVGAACVAELVRRGYHVRAAVRDPKGAQPRRSSPVRPTAARACAGLRAQTARLHF